MDAKRLLRVYPRTMNSDFASIWRNASSVRWDESDQSLYVLPGTGLSVVDEFRQIVGAVEAEYGDRLMVNESTLFAVGPEVAEKLRNAAAES